VKYHFVLYECRACGGQLQNELLLSYTLNLFRDIVLNGVTCRIILINYENFQIGYIQDH